MTNTIVTKKVNPVQQGVGTSSAQLCAPGFDIAAKAAAMLAGNSRSAAQAAQERFEAAVVVLKTTPLSEPKPQPTPPAMTPSVVAKLTEALRGPIAMEFINRIGRVRGKETWRNALIILVSQVAPQHKSWVFDATQDFMGEAMKVVGTTAKERLDKLDAAGLIRYSHPDKTDGETGHAKKRIDLRPLIAELWESCVNTANSHNRPENKFAVLSNDPPTNVHAVYSGKGKHADATMRTLYRFAIARRGYPTVLARSVTKSALTFLDFLVRNGAATRAEACAGTGMTPGAAAGGSRVLEQLGLVSVEWDGPGTAKLYVLHPDWEAHLQATIPHMTSYGARIRLVIRNYDKWIGAIERQVKTLNSPRVVAQLNDRKRKLEAARRKWCDVGRKTGAYGRFVEVMPWMAQGVAA